MIKFTKNTLIKLKFYVMKDIKIIIYLFIIYEYYFIFLKLIFTSKLINKKS